MRILLFSVFAGSCVISRAAYVNLEGRTNLLPNPSFETPHNPPTRPEGWNLHVPEGDVLGWSLNYVDNATEAHSGARAIRMSGVFSRGDWRDRLYVYSDKVPVDPAKRYVGRLWYRTAGIPNSGRVLVRVKFYNSAGTNPSYADRLMELDPASDGWGPFDFPLWLPVESAPRDFTHVTFQIYLDHAAGSVWVDDCGLYEINDADWSLVYPFGRFAAPEIVTTGSRPSFSTSDTVTVRRDAAGVWWFVMPDGTPYYHVATGTGVSENSTLTSYLSTVRGITTAQYDGETRVRAGSDLFFNAGTRQTTSGATRRRIDWLNFSTETDLSGTDWVLKAADGSTFGEADHYFPDPFSTVWQDHAVTEAQGISDWSVERPDFVGYFTDNEWAYGPMCDYFWSDACKVALVKWLQGQLAVPEGFAHPAPYASIAQLNAAWSSGYHTFNYAAFEDIYGADKPRVRAFDDPVATDLYRFERVVLRKYTDVVIGAIRNREDELIQQLASEGRQGYHRLIFSCRIAWEGPGPADEFLQRNADILGAFDVIAINAYPVMLHSTDHHPRSHFDAMKALFHDTTGRPLFISEFGIAGLDSGVPVRRWDDRTAFTQSERGQGYHNLSATWGNCPWMVGQTWFKWANGYAGDGSDPRNCGLVDDSDQYYDGLTSRMGATNVALNEIRRSGSFGSAEIDWRPLEFPIYEGQAPEIAIEEPDGVDDVSTGSFTIRYNASDTDSSASVRLYASPSLGTAANGSPIAVGLGEGLDATFAWNTQGLPAGSYWIVAEIRDGTGPPQWAQSAGPIVVGTTPVTVSRLTFD